MAGPPAIALLQILKELKSQYEVDELDDLRIIRDRVTKRSRGFGFIRFLTLDKARAFVERNYPTIYLYGNASGDGDEQAAPVRIAFSRERSVRGRSDKEGEWKCKISSAQASTFLAARSVLGVKRLKSVSFSGRGSRSSLTNEDITAYGNVTQSKQAEFLNSGDSDAALQGPPSQFLLFRGLEPNVTEELLAKGVAKLYKPPSATAGTNMSKKGIAKVASTTGDSNLGAKEGSIRRVLLVRDRRSNESWRYGFAEFATVEEAQAAITRFNSFEKFTISSKPVTASYIHSGVFVPVFEIHEENTSFTFRPLGNNAVRLQYWDENAYVSELVVSKLDEPSPGPVDGPTKSATDLAAAAAEREGLLAPGQESDVRTKKRKAETKEVPKQKKTAPAHLQFWSNRHAELHGGRPPPRTEEQITVPSDDKQQAKSISSRSSSPPSQSYGDPNKHCCYLCSRQFKTSAEVNKHERLSGLHRENLHNEDLKAKALTKMGKAGILIAGAKDDTREYRDRAKERRAAFGSSKKVSLPMKKAAVDAPASVEEGAETLPSAPSKGASLLGKMGWAAGEGLGAKGEGTTRAITTDLYVAGVGLGAQGGKVGDAVEEAARNSRGNYGEFLERTRDKAKERFEKMA